VSKVDAGRVMAALVKRYRAPEWALFEQVGNGTGFSGNRWADAMAMSLWPSRGLDLFGFEVKVYRNDWLRELRNPSKAEEVATYCDFWNVVAGGPGIVEKSEVPALWGLMELRGGKLLTVKPAERRTPAVDLDRPLVAAILRRATEGMVPRSSIEALIHSAHAEGIETGKARAEGTNGLEAAQREATNLRATIEAFEKESGVTMSQYAGGRIGRAVRMASQIGELELDHRLTHSEHQLERALESIRSAKSPDALVTGGDQ
jgi:hypothetical protein